MALTDSAARAPGHHPGAFLVGAVAAALMTLVFLLWVVFGVGGDGRTLQVDDIGQLVAAWCATVVCGTAAIRRTPGRVTWALLAASSFSWGAGELVWCHYALVRHVSVPFPSLADVGFLAAVPLAFAGLLHYFMGRHRTGARVQAVLDGLIIATSLLFASWATILGPLYRSHQGGPFKQMISLAYPTSDVVMVSLVIILIARAGPTGRVRLGLVMTGIVAFAVSDSAFSYLTEVNGYNGGSFLDTGWVAGYLLIALGALWAMTAPAPEVSETEESVLSLIAPYVPVLVVLAVTAVQLLRGRPIGTVSWLMVLVLVVLVLGRELRRLLGRSNDDDPCALDPGSQHRETATTATATATATTMATAGGALLGDDAP